MSYKSKDVMKKFDPEKPIDPEWDYGREAEGADLAKDVTTNLMPCCDAWAKAHERKTDNEQYGRLIHCNDETDPEYAEPYPTIGSGLPPVKFCPWCGAEKGKGTG